MVLASTMTHGEDAHHDLGLHPLSQLLPHQIMIGKYGDPLCKNCSCTPIHKLDYSGNSWDPGILLSIHNGVGTEIPLRTQSSSNSTLFGTNGSGVTQQAITLGIITQLDAHRLPKPTWKGFRSRKYLKRLSCTVPAHTLPFQSMFLDPSTMQSPS